MRTTAARHALGLLLFFALVGALAWAYAGMQRSFPFWDDASFYQIALEKMILWRGLGLRAWVGQVWGSSAHDYSDWFVVPLYPILQWGRGTYPVYLLGLAWMTFFPWVVVVGLLARRLFPAMTGRTFWAGLAAVAILPAAWVPSLKGYPDALAAACFALALLLYAQSLSSRRLGPALGAGVVLAVSILVRRHFIYPALAFLLAAALEALFERPAWARPMNFVRVTFPVLASAAGVLIALLLFGLPFVERLWGTNFQTLYASYEQSAWVNWSYYTRQSGWGVLGLAALGWAWAAPENRRLARFLLLQVALAALIWWGVVRQLGVHYNLHFLVWIGLGICALGLKLLSRGRRWAWPALGTAVFLLLNFLQSLFAPQLLTHLPAVLRPFFSTPAPPAVRSDYDRLVRLLSDLDQLTDPEAPILVAASSPTLNDDLLWNAQRALHENVLDRSPADFWSNRGLNILHWTPFVDSRDPYPLTELLQAQVVVLAAPFQTHLRPEEQDLVRVTDWLLQGPHPIAQDFERLPHRYSLENGVQVSLWRRIRPTRLDVALQTLEEMQSFVGERPAGQTPWLEISPAGGRSPIQAEAGRVDIDFLSAKRAFLYLDPAPSAAQIRGQVEVSAPECLPLRLEVALLDAQAVSLEQAAVSLSQAGAFRLDLAPFSLPAETHLLLSTFPQGGTTQTCWFRLEDLQVGTP